MDFKKFAETLGLEEDEFAELAELFLDTCIGDLEKLDAAIADGNAQEAAKAAHSIKGAAGNLGFLDLSDIAKDIEIAARNGSVDGSSEKAALLRAKLNALENTIRGA